MTTPATSDSDGADADLRVLRRRDARRHTLWRALAREGAGGSMIILTRSVPSRNMHRFYAMHLAPTLFGEWDVVSEWGRIGSPGRIKQQVFPTIEAAQTALTKRLRVKTRRGYQLRPSLLL